MPARQKKKYRYSPISVNARLNSKVKLCKGTFDDAGMTATVPKLVLIFSKTKKNQK